jgi:hypothetical protein
MRPSIGGSVRCGTIPIGETLARLGEATTLATHREWVVLGVEDRQRAQQSGKTNPKLIWERFADYSVLGDWCRLWRNLQNEPKVNLDKVCGLSWLVMGDHAQRKTTQTKPTLPEWRPDRLRGLMKNEQTKPTLPEWQPATWSARGGGARTKPKKSRSHSRRRANEATARGTTAGTANEAKMIRVGSAAGVVSVSSIDGRRRMVSVVLRRL